MYRKENFVVILDVGTIYASEKASLSAAPATTKNETANREEKAPADEWKCINKNSIQILDFASWR